MTVAPLPAISLKGVRRHYDDGAGNEKAALDIDELEIQPGELVAVIGPSGSGKSTLLQLVGGIDSPTAGCIDVAGLRVSEMDEKQKTIFRRENIGFIFQAFHLVPSMTVVENVGLSSIVSGQRGFRWRSDALVLLDQLGLFEYAERFPDQLSGGQRQRVAVARALFGAPSVVLADEPTGSLDSGNRDIVLRLIRDAIGDGRRTTGLMVTHDPYAASYADRIIALRDGKIVDQLDLTLNEPDREGDSHHDERVRSWFAATSL
ncbi:MULTISPECIES: ABC transporter ATP-binding protein [Arthrobacter]|jgi:ABC-type lipoprotein export system ATPase subunit|uniref:ABC-type lipoprotein export system ATPase subunit n=1 Tax=Arthrobacter bambusae TaxID=1338426 RepID=A0AAW8DMK5_9MICC|nr:ABC transporter ATP-binding protein [Arthrobacter bambusae]MDP9907564.1 ABC-type lipoprotein export system ATPase subunit [Arthrobacter bambusae]MDQ0131769.1 ABC-type lipoprotein export system ATPase subunit [Arthrobacter bambusae]MDQ0183181.1 ABC-type lipoprotein export system ATPase subunit [Arthrobacter bambusae]